MINQRAAATGAFTSWPVTGADNAYPAGKLVASRDGKTLYGTTYGFGIGAGYGTVFRMDVVSGIITTLHTFCGPHAPVNDGRLPIGGLVLSPDGWLYGTTFNNAGAGDAGYYGTVFAVSTTDDDTDPPGTYYVLHNFSNALVPTKLGGPPTIFDGSAPWAGLTMVENNLFGTTTSDGQGGEGTVFGMNVSNGQLTPNSYFILHRFDGLAGGKPYGDLVYNAGWLYGTAEEAGAYYGCVFVVGTAGDDNGNASQFRIIHNFSGSSDNPLTDQYGSSLYDGGYPVAGLVMSGNWLYGTTAGAEMQFPPLGPPSQNAISWYGSLLGLKQASQSQELARSC